MTSGRNAPTTTSAVWTPQASIRAAAPTEPTTRASIVRPSRTPNTRERTSFGVTRCSRVRPETSPTLRPAPAAANRIGALTADGATATRPIGAPNSTAPPASDGLSRRRPTSRIVDAAPRTAPAPNAALRNPAPLAPMSSSWIAVETNSTSSAPTTITPEDRSMTTRRGSGARRSVWNPRSVSCQTSAASIRASGVTAPTSTGSRATSSAPSSVRTAKIAKTAPGPDVASTTPAMIGPIILPTPSTMPETTFAAVRSDGVFVSAGSSEFCAGRVKVMLMDAIVAAAYTSATGASACKVTAVAAIASPCTR